MYASHKHPHRQTHGVTESSNLDQAPTSTSTLPGSSSQGLSDAPSTQYNPVVTMSNPTSHPSSPSFFEGGYTEIFGDMSSSRLDLPKELKRTTGPLHCYWTSHNQWTAQRNVPSRTQKHDYQDNNTRLHAQTIMYKTILGSLQDDPRPPCMHDASSVQDALLRVQTVLDEQLTAMPQSEVHLVCHFLFYDDRTLNDGTLEVLITIEYYQAPRQTGTKIWNRRGSLITTTGPWYEAIGSKNKHDFMESVLLDPLSSGCYPLQPQDTLAESITALQRPHILSEAVMNPCVVMSLNAESTIISPAPPNSIIQDVPIVSTSGLNLDLGPGPTFACHTDDTLKAGDLSVPSDDGCNEPSAANSSSSDDWWAQWLGDEATRPQDTSSLFPTESLSSLVNRYGTQPSHTDAPPLAACVSPTDTLLFSAVQEPKRILSSTPKSSYTDDNVEDIDIDDGWRLFLNHAEGDYSITDPETKPANSTDGSIPKPIAINLNTDTDTDPNIATNNKVGTPLSSRAGQEHFHDPQTVTNSADDSQQPGPSPGPSETTKPKPARKAKTLPPGNFRCPKPGCSAKPYTTQFSLSSHLSSVHGDRAYRCLYCVKKYRRYGDCARHEDIVHRGKRWKCKGCGLEKTRRPSEKQRAGCGTPYVKKQDRRTKPYAKQGAGSKKKGRHHFKIDIPNPYPIPLDGFP